MEINLGTILFTMLNALLIYVILRKILFVPVTNFMNNRTNSIQNQIKEAEDKVNSANQLKAQYEAKISKAEADGKKIVDEYKSKASKLYDDMVEEAKHEAELVRERARVDAEREKEKARDEVKKQIVTLSLLAASKAVAEQLDDEKHHALIEEFINKVGV